MQGAAPCRANTMFSCTMQAPHPLYMAKGQQLVCARKVAMLSAPCAPEQSLQVRHQSTLTLCTDAFACHMCRQCLLALVAAAARLGQLAVP